MLTLNAEEVAAVARYRKALKTLEAEARAELAELVARVAARRGSHRQ